MPFRLPAIDDIHAAAGRLGNVAVRTPLLENPEINRMLGGRLLIKAETLQIAGAFKFRGAYNRLLQIAPADRAGGVVAWSSGNHGQGVAAAARMLGMPAVIVMPADAPAIKIENTRGYGAEVVLYDRATESREEIGNRLAAARGAVIVPPYDDPDIIAGQGTAALEIEEDASRRAVTLDALLVPCSGGGLAAGSAIAMAGTSPGTRIVTVEPAGFDDMARSLEAGIRLQNATPAGSICDALMAPVPGELTFAINRKLVAFGIAVTDDEVRAAMRFAFSHLKLVVEPGGAVALAAILSGKYNIKGRAAAIILSGGNVDPAFFISVLQNG